MPNLERIIGNLEGVAETISSSNLCVSEHLKRLAKELESLGQIKQQVILEEPSYGPDKHSLKIEILPKKKGIKKGRKLKAFCQWAECEEKDYKHLIKTMHKYTVDGKLIHFHSIECAKNYFLSNGMEYPEEE